MIKFSFICLGILFGSIAKGGFRPESDIDIAILASKTLNANDKMAIISDFACEFGRPVDLIDLSVAGEPLLGQILKSGKIIINQNSCYGRLLSRHLFDQSDFMPYKNRILRGKETEMDWIVIEQKLESLRRAVKRVQEKYPDDINILSNDYDIQDIIVLNLSRAVQICVDIGAMLISETDFPPPDTMGEVFYILHKAGIIRIELADNLKKTVGFRNLSLHNYRAIDWMIVDFIVKKHLSDFEDFAKLLLNFMNNQRLRVFMCLM